MNEPRLEIPQSLHLSTQQHDFGETIVLFTGDPGAHTAVGTVYNWDDYFPRCEEEQAEDIEEIAIATAEKIVRAYNSHDDLLAELKNIANARRHSLEDADEFRTWAQSRARHVIAKAKGESDEIDQ